MAQSVPELIDALRALRQRRNSLSAPDFRQAFLELVRVLCLAEGAAWAEWEGPAEGAPVPRVLTHTPGLSTLQESTWLAGACQRAEANQFSVLPARSGQETHARVVIRLAAPEPAFLVLLVGPEAATRLNDIVLRAQLVADLPDGGTDSSPSATLASDVTSPVVDYLDLIARLYPERRFRTAAYTLLNGLVAHSLEIDQAVLGWQEGAYVRVQAISHFDRFEKKTEWVKALEAAMEEAADQQEPVLYTADKNPAAEGIRLAHHQLLVQTGCRALLTLPVPADQGANDAPVVLMLIAQTQPFSQSTADALQVLAHLVAPRLAELRRRSENPFKRLVRGLRGLAGGIVGKDYVWTKLATILISGLIVYGLFGTLPHRVETEAELTTDRVRLISAPFEGQVDEALVASGDRVQAGQVLARMNTEDLLLQRAELQADRQRNQAEVNRARADNDFTQVEVASARIQQNEARLQRLALYLQQAALQAPFASVVVEGDPQNLAGQSVGQGDALYRLARIEDMYLTIRVPERQVHFVDIGEQGEFAFLSRPGQTLPFRVEQLVPVAEVQGQSGAVFRVRAHLETPAQDWWRPGMTGVAKIDQGRRPVYWVLGHEFMNRLRLWLWW